MTEPASTAGGAFAGYKLFLFSLPFIGAVLAFWLGIRFVPLKKGAEWKDAVDRLTAGAISSFVLGVPTLIFLARQWPGIFGAMNDLAAAASISTHAVTLLVYGTVFLLCALPGTWLFAAVFGWLRKTEGKDLGEIVQDLRGKGER
ncbi:hypothetical protein AZ34_10475 [Hylemonella gracilis str. Niagara R]|uniref:Uncharacterized protein n=1 Tax=Hylemonella gracilis str. Niagara R TaxID=1458275 RepID=A0A016XIR8_9BURK|nr:hypothetical protein [Hylemonella gracilis]EYC51457.1 hypothetical protein AZ34_10475 [Hylemonella gracilis str. Niagara R]